MRGLYNVGGQEGGVKREANYLFIHENVKFLHIKYSDLRSQTNEQDLLVLFKTENFQNM